MRVAFLTSCLEPGKDGVGDYARGLAAACVQSGCACTLVALNDSRVDRLVTEVQVDRGVPLNTLRFPASSRWSERLPVAQDWLHQHGADWLSLQFVPYGFHPKGVVVGLGSKLAGLGERRRWHVMFHELWLGTHEGSPVRRVIGWAQRRAIMSLIDSLAPAMLHTSNSAYRALLASAGARAAVLPLCGNIAVSEEADAGWFARELDRLGVPREVTTSLADCWWFGLFGSVHPEWSPEPLFGYLQDAAERAGRRLGMASIGRLGRGESLWRTIQARYADRFLFATFGERSATEVSAFLRGIDFGIATTPWEVIGKSGATAAMLDHGLPVIVSRDDVHIPVDVEPEPQPLLCKMDAQLPSWLLNVAQRQPPRERVTEVAERFLADLAAQSRDADVPRRET